MGIPNEQTAALEVPHQVGDTDRLWVRGGFPDSVLASNNDVGSRSAATRMLRLSQVIERTQLGKTTIYALQKPGRQE